MSGDEFFYFGGVHVDQEFLKSFAEEGVCHALLGTQEVVDAFFDGTPANQFVDKDIAMLADAVGSVGGLVFDGGVPPAVEVDDVGSLGEGEAGACGFKREDEEGRACVLLELPDDSLPGGDGSAAVEQETVAMENAGQKIVQRVDHAAELGKEDEFFLPGGNLFG